MGNFERKSVLETASERRISEKGVEKGMERNLIGNVDQGRGQFSETFESLH
jgi:hypothetical protein